MYLVLIRKLALTAGTLLAIVACGGGGGYSTAGGGTGGTGVSSGPITGFGSVIVNGVEFFTETAIVTEDGIDGPGEYETDADGNDLHRGLRKGMVVQVQGTFDGNIGPITGLPTGTATSVTYQSNIIGPITAGQLSNLAPGHSTTVTVLGQSVVIDSQTWIGTPTEDGTQGVAGNLALNNVVAVSGLTDVSGVIRATRVEITAPTFDPGAIIEVKGVVDQWDGVASFQIRDLTVNYSNEVSVPADFAEGRYVEVKGKTADGITLTATKIELEDDGVGAVAEGARVEVEGYITAGNADLFTVRGQQVQTDASTRYEGSGSLSVNTLVEVEGLVTNGILMATKVEFK